MDGQPEKPSLSLRNLNKKTCEHIFCQSKSNLVVDFLFFWSTEGWSQDPEDFFAAMHLRLLAGRYIFIYENAVCGALTPFVLTFLGTAGKAVEIPTKKYLVGEMPAK